MRLSSTVRKFKNVIGCLLLFYILGMSMLTPTSAYNLVNGNNPANDNLLLSNLEKEIITTIISEENSDFTSRIDIKKDIRPEEVGSSYTAVNFISDVGGNFDVRDNLSVIHDFSLNLTQDSGVSTNHYTISNISDYSPVNLNYDIKDITAIKDYYPVEDQTSGGAHRERLTWYGHIAFAQEFTVEWEYAMFYGAKLLLNYLIQDITGNYELELKLVNASTTTPYGPNISSELSNDLNDPYDSSNTPPVGTSSNIRFFDFTDVLLEKGSYYIVANLTTIDNTDDTTYDYFGWDKYLLAPYDGKTFSMDNGTTTWDEETYDLNLIPELLPSFDNGTALVFSDPNIIDLKDNSTTVVSLTSSISGSGVHVLTANTSVQLTLLNPYTFFKTYIANSIFTVIKR